MVSLGEGSCLAAGYWARDLERAAEFFEPLYQADKSAVPDLIRQAVMSRVTGRPAIPDGH
jgi:hypothetical protein